MKQAKNILQLYIRSRIVFSEPSDMEDVIQISGILDFFLELPSEM